MTLRRAIHNQDELAEVMREISVDAQVWMMHLNSVARMVIDYGKAEETAKALLVCADSISELATKLRRQGF